MVSPKPLTTGSLFLAAALVCSCNGGEGRDLEIVYEDGIRVLVYRDTPPSVIDPYQIGPRVLYASVKGDSSALLVSAYFGGRSDGGTVYVSDPRDRRIHRYSPDGRHLGAFGRSGEGPGEFSGSPAAEVFHDRVHVWDDRSARLSLFSLEGEFLGSHRLQGLTSMSLPATLTPFRHGAATRYAGSSTRTFSEARGEIPGPTTRTGRWTLRIFTEDLGSVETLVDTSIVTEGVVLGGERLMMQTGSPYYLNLVPQYSTSTSGMIAWEYGAEYRVDLLNAGSGKRLSFRVRRPASPLPDSLRERTYRSYTVRGLDEQARRRFQFSETLPVISYLVWDRLDRLWVMDYARPGSNPESLRFEVFDSEGRWLFRQDLPRRPTAIFADGFFTGAADAEGGPAVAFYPIRAR